MNKKKAAAVAVAAVMACGILAGCDLVTRNETANMNQTVAEVNITNSKSFKTEFAELDEQLVNKVIGTSTVSKRDMIVSFVGSGYSAMSSYGWSYKDTFDAISNSLVQRQVYIQYAKAYFLKNGWTDEDDANKEYSYKNLDEFNATVKDETGVRYEIAALSHFLTKKETKKALFTTRVMFNNSIDTLEENYIKNANKDKDTDTDVRTTPKGLDTTDSDFVDDFYTVYTGTGEQNAVRGSYEAKDGSTSTTRRSAYNDLLASLKSNDLVQNGEDTSDVEKLNYFLLEYKVDLEDVLIQKLAEVFTKQAEADLDETYCTKWFNTSLSEQRENYAASSSNLESAMDSVSDTKFVLTATGDSEAESAYGFVINILLPFSAAQTDELNAVKQDFGDKKGNKFATRARLLSKIKATDQRGSWFKGETDYSYKATAGENAFGYNTDGEKPREWLFFKSNLNEETSKYERLKNYYGKYTYNGKWDAKERKYKPYPITIADFMSEMEGYLTKVFGAGKVETTTTVSDDDYFNAGRKYYYEADDPTNDIKEGDVNYEQFVYYAGKINFDGGFNANRIFDSKSDENKAMSVINELSFAYNTDTAGLNTYLGYAVTANKTSFVSEFEYAAQKVVKEGAGHYIVVPSDYGWHIIYCTFSFVDTGYGAAGGIKTPFKFEFDKTGEEYEGTFSYLFYESLKADAASKESTNRRSKIISAYNDSFTVYEDRYSDLSNLGSNS